MNNKFKKDALRYHSAKPKGKIAVNPTKPHATQRDLALAYSPGVAEPCKEIEKNKNRVYDYTAKGNLVAVISNGTAVLGLGDIGPEASKPVMEGKGLLFKIFADIDVFDIEVNERDPDKFIEIVKAISPTFGGINLEDIKAPEAFEIERRLKEELNIPVMHDDQHGTAIISAAALLNALELAHKKIEDVKIVVNGAGAAAIACTKLYISLGANPQNIIMCDSKGVISKKRTDLNSQKQEFARETKDTTLQEALVNADVFIGLSKGNILTPEMLHSMAPNPIVFAMANPTPEIDYPLAIQTRDDIIMATGRSDYPNQVNNVLGFPYIFRGALDVQATCINEDMKRAAVYALADLAKEAVPESVLMAYNDQSLSFGKNYIIPKPFDNRLISTISIAVAKAAMESGVAQKPIQNWNEYEEELLDRLENDQKLIRIMQNRARSAKKKVVFSNADEFNVLKAAQIMSDEGLADPILLGNEKRIAKLKEENGIELDAPIFDPRSDETFSLREKFAHKLWNKRNRRGITLYDARRNMRSKDYFGAMMVETAEADAFINGYSKSYPKALRPLLEVIGKAPKVEKVSGLMMLLTEKGPMFLADTTIIKNPTWQELANVAKMTSRVIKSFGIEPRIAMLSYENFSSDSAVSKEVAKAVEYLHNTKPEMIVDGEVQPDFALEPHLMLKEFPFSKLAGKKANTFIFPDLTSGNITYKMLRGINHEQQAIGPILLGMNKPAHVLTMGAGIDEIVNLATIAVLHAQEKDEH